MSDTIICEFCNIILKNKNNLKAHLTNSKKCLNIRNIPLDNKFVCTGCDSIFTLKTNLTKHLDICKSYSKAIREEKEKEKKENSEKINIEIKEHYEKIINEMKEQYEKEIKELHLLLEIKEHKIKIDHLTKKYVKSQPRIQYKEKNVIYILTTPSHKKERKYILGKATDLTNRLSTYNKTDEHEVVYYQECPDEDTMAMIEQVVFQRLKDYREQANRERFILPYGESINKFIDIIKKSIEFLK